MEKFALMKILKLFRAGGIRALGKHGAAPFYPFMEMLSAVSRPESD
jgi:hypothetical protein